jgi:hypothetical protein
VRSSLLHGGRRLHHEADSKRKGACCETPKGNVPKGGIVVLIFLGMEGTNHAHTGRPLARLQFRLGLPLRLVRAKMGVYRLDADLEPQEGNKVAVRVVEGHLSS